MEEPAYFSRNWTDLLKIGKYSCCFSFVDSMHGILVTVKYTNSTHSYKYWWKFISCQHYHLVILNTITIIIFNALHEIFMSLYLTQSLSFFACCWKLEKQHTLGLLTYFNCPILTWTSWSNTFQSLRCAIQHFWRTGSSSFGWFLSYFRKTLTNSFATLHRAGTIFSIFIYTVFWTSQSMNTNDTS